MTYLLIRKQLSLKKSKDYYIDFTKYQFSMRLLTFKYFRTLYIKIEFPWPKVVKNFQCSFFLENSWVIIFFLPQFLIVIPKLISLRMTIVVHCCQIIARSISWEIVNLLNEKMELEKSLES